MTSIGKDFSISSSSLRLFKSQLEVVYIDSELQPKPCDLEWSGNFDLCSRTAVIAKSVSLNFMRTPSVPSYPTLC